MGDPLSRLYLSFVRPCSGLRSVWLLILVILYLPVAHATDGSFSHSPQVQAFIHRLVANEQFNKAYLERLFADVKPQPAVIAAMKRPAESLPWYQYRPIFLTRKRAREGAAFWRHHQAALIRAQKIYGVPPQIVTAIIGVESYYGRHMGDYPVFDTLATLSFDYPPRARFFREQLAQYLLLMRSENIDPLKPKGSYAGAMGQGQFMPGSYRHYGVDFDDNGQRDLWNNPVDVIGSVANYLALNGWQRDGFIAERARATRRNVAHLSGGLKPNLTSVALAAAGVRPAGSLRSGGRYALVRLQTAQDPEFWITGENFYAITRYNASALYAMAVYQLSMAILQVHDKHADMMPVAGNLSP